MLKLPQYRGVGRFKGFLFVSAVAITMILLWYSQEIVNGLRWEARNILLFYAKLYARAINEENDSALNFIFEEIIKRTDFPIILAGPNGEPTAWKGIEVSPDSTYSPQAMRKVKKIMEGMIHNIDPIPLIYRYPDTTDSNVVQKEVNIGYLIYGDSKRIQQLQWLPYIEIGVVGLFILVGFVGFNSIRRGEQQFIWVGMAKETAHQLGTPISSLLGWVELLRIQVTDNSDASKTFDEMQRDINHLEKIASRFSQIGSRPDLKEQDIVSLTHDVVKYFRKRLPQMGSSVEINIHNDQLSPIAINRDLFGWVLENLIKNALDAIESKDGKITIEMKAAVDKPYHMIIDVQDNGRGIDLVNYKNVFRPGFSTKKRGWGLGLSLAKRIVEDYHQGKLMVKESQIGRGTTMRVIL